MASKRVGDTDRVILNSYGTMSLPCISTEVSIRSHILFYFIFLWWERGKCVMHPNVEIFVFVPPGLCR